MSSQTDSSSDHAGSIWSAVKSSFFANANRFTINGATFQLFCGSEGSEPGQAIYVDGIPVIPRIHLEEQIRERKGSRFSIATIPFSEKKVIVQVFEGPQANQLWKETLRYSRCMVNAHILGIVGISKPAASDDDVHYIAFGGRHENDSHYLLAEALRKGDKEITTIGSQIVYGASSGLDYLFSSRIISVEDIKSTNFEVFSDRHGHTAIVFAPDILPKAPDFTVANTKSVLDSLILEVFKEANYVIYREKVERHDDDLQSNEDLERNHATGISPRHHSQLNSGNSTSTQDTESNMDANPASITVCRREIVWRSLNSDLALSEISKLYRDLLRIHSSLDNTGQYLIDFPRRSGERKSATQHRCKGYIREEITLTPDAFCNSVSVFEKPSLNEICGMCGEVVQYQESGESEDGEAAGNGEPNSEGSPLIVRGLAVALSWPLIEPGRTSARKKRPIICFDIAFDPRKSRGVTVQAFPDVAHRVDIPSDTIRLPASSHCILTEMQIFLDVEDFRRWPVKVKRKSGIRCLDVFYTIYETFQRTLNPEDIRSFGLPLYNRQHGTMRRVDLLRGRRFFRGIVRSGEDWMLLLDDYTSSQH
ncbi:hypothetical protein BDP27DRAFT_1449109 [Rhodocollybia butyracea]|uniref:DUF6699 domain-containing protein n=1 Tax=Rhodocollybia butyracea TaxID=206335 RepID=A0A9P5PSP2_9AGAR|nr:hypothetical protein BDP27DRAFT_1449109 [Rhodocollybia butyracea]